MTTLKHFENKLGYATLSKTNDDKFILQVHSDFAKVGHFLEYDYRADAISNYQFYCWWLTDNEKNVI